MLEYIIFNGLAVPPLTSSRLNTGKYYLPPVEGAICMNFSYIERGLSTGVLMVTAKSGISGIEEEVKEL